jgi:hypothetical protein
MRPDRFLLFLLFILIGKISHSQQLHVLFLGNSYTGVNNLPQLVSDVSLSAGDTLIFNSNTPGGYTLDQHFVDSNSMNLVRQGGWDYLVLQEQSQLPAFQDYLSNGPTNLTQTFSLFNPCGRSMFYMTWGRKNGDASNCAAWPPVCTYQGMDSMLRLRYFEMADVNKSELSPVGKVWNRIRQLYPALELYQADESHPSEAGSYAAACCFYTALFKEDPTQITFDYTLSAGDASLIRQVAREIVYDSLPQYNFTQFNPQALFHYSIGQGINEIYLWNYSTDAETYLWDFGDGNTSTNKNPIHSYAANGTYTITLTAFDCDLYQTYQSVSNLQVSFCNHSPTAYPDSLKLCPNTHDTLWTQVYDSYQWLDYNGDPIPGETNQYFLPTMSAEYSVIASSAGCSETSPPVYVESYLNNLVIYNLDTTLALFPPDTACLGDTVYLIIYPNKPGPPYYYYQWYMNGLLQNYAGDTLAITAPGDYQVTVHNQLCQGYPVYQSPVQTINFRNCNTSVEEYSEEAARIYPVPADKIIFLENFMKGDYIIYDVYGKVVLTGTIKYDFEKADVSPLASGTYFLQGSTAFLRFIKN